MTEKKIRVLLVFLFLPLLASCGDSTLGTDGRKRSLEKEMLTIRENQEDLREKMIDTEEDKKNLEKELENARQENLFLKRKNKKLEEDLKSKEGDSSTPKELEDEVEDPNKIDSEEYSDNEIKKASPPKKSERKRKNSSEKTKEKSKISFFLILPNIDDMSGDISRYLVPVEQELDLSINAAEEKIEHALDSLLSIGSSEYGARKLQNNLHLSSLSLKKVHKEGKTITIDLEGKIVSIGSIADAFTKKQITKTVEHYTDDYLIRLNGSEAEWRCALDKSGMCQ